MSTQPRLQVVPDPEKRTETLRIFAGMLQLPRITRIVQRGRQPESARYTIELADGRTIRVGTIKTLWSQSQLIQVLGVVVGRVPPPIEPKDWRKMIAALMNHAIEVEEAPGESFADITLDWLRDYARNPSTDANGAAARGRPYVKDGWLHIHAPSFGLYIKRSLHGTFERLELLQALVDLGFERRTINYTASGKRSTISLYRAQADVLHDGGAPEQEP